MTIYLPQQQMPYGSDPFQQGASGSYYFPQTVTELTDAVAAAIKQDTPDGTLL